MHSILSRFDLTSHHKPYTQLLGTPNRTHKKSNAKKKDIRPTTMKIAAYGLALIHALCCGAKANGFLLRSSPRLAAEASSIRLSSMPGPVYAQIKGARARTAYCLRVREGGQGVLDLWVYRSIGMC